MIKEHDHNGIRVLSPSEREFRSNYKRINGTTKGATRAYQRWLYSNNKQDNIAKRQHLVEVLINCTPEINDQLICEQLFMEDFVDASVWSKLKGILVMA